MSLTPDNYFNLPPFLVEEIPFCLKKYRTLCGICKLKYFDDFTSYSCGSVEKAKKPFGEYCSEECQREAFRRKFKDDNW